MQNSRIHLLFLICDWQKICLSAKLTKVSAPMVLHYSCLAEEPFVFTIIVRIGKAGPCSANFRQCWKKKKVNYLLFSKRKRSKLGQFISLGSLKSFSYFSFIWKSTIFYSNRQSQGVFVWDWSLESFPWKVQILFLRCFKGLRFVEGGVKNSFILIFWESIQSLSYWNWIYTEF